MTFTTGLRRLASTAAAAAFLFAAPAFAQEISDTHLKAARDAVAAINASDDYDDILPALAKTVKTDLIQSNPDLQAVITQTVDEVTLSLVPRRVDLEKEIALAYAKAFSEADLTAIAAFYNSPAGQKLLTEGPIASRETNKAVEIWQRGVARDMSQQVNDKLTKIVGAMAPAPGTPLSPDPAAPQASGEGTEQPATSN